MLTDADLARLEELHRLAEELPWNPMADEKYIEAACNMAPALVAEVRKLRAALNKEHRAWQCAEMRGDVLEAENAVLRDRVEALEWFVECRDFAMWMSGSNRNVAFLEAVLSAEAAREAIR